MVVNWVRYLQLMIPIRLRRSRLLFILLWSLSSYTRRMYDVERLHTEGLIEELGYTSQTMALERLLRNKFSEDIEIIDGTNELISLINGDDTDMLTYIGDDIYYYAMDDEDTEHGLDFRIRVPESIDKKDVRIFVDKYVFYGRKYEVINKE